METVLIIPIGGLLVALGILAIFGIFWMWSTANDYKDALIVFANESTDTVAIVIGIIVLLIALMAVIIEYSSVPERKDLQKSSFSRTLVEMLFRAIFLAVPYWMGIMALYAWCIYMINAMVGIAAESVLMWISIPLVFIFAAFGFIVGLVPMIALYCFEVKVIFQEDGDEDDLLLFQNRFLKPFLLDLAASAIYLFLIFTCTDLPTFLVSSFSTW